MKRFLFILGFLSTLLPHTVTAMKTAEVKSNERLRYASAVGNPEVVEAQLKLGADKNSTDCNGKTPLMLAATKWYDRGEQYDSICNKYYKEEDIKTCKILDKQNECIKILLEHGASVLYQDNESFSFMDHLYDQQNTDALQIVIEHLKRKKESK